MARTVTGLDVPFFGEDGRSTVFRVGRLPLPGWHAPLAEAFWKNPFSATSYSNVGDNRNGVPARRSHSSQSPGS